MPLSRTRLRWSRLLYLCGLLLIFSSCKLASGQAPFQPNLFNSVPTFVIIGSAKGGTTDLYDQVVCEEVNKDPTRVDPPVRPGLRKELNFLPTVRDINELMPGTPLYIKYLRYLGHACGNSTTATITSCLRSHAGGYYTIDASPTYLAAARAPLALSNISPHTKVIAMLREPVERAEIFFRHIMVMQGKWADKSMDEFAESFLTMVQEDPSLRTVFKELKECKTMECMANGWYNATTLGLFRQDEYKPFAHGLYRYALAQWRVHYFQPGRFMIINSDVYYKERVFVMDKVIQFLFGRSMTRFELARASATSYQRKSAKHLKKVGRNWVLSDAWRRKMKQFFDEHVVRGFTDVLESLQKDGAWVVGFDGESWARS